MKLMQRYGWKLVCGWLPPTGVMANALMFTLGASEMNILTEDVDAPTRLFCGFVAVPLALVARNGWVWADI